MVSLVGETIERTTNAGRLYLQLYLSHHALNHLHRNNNFRDHVRSTGHDIEQLTGFKATSTNYKYEDDSSKHHGGLIDLWNHQKERPLLEVCTSYIKLGSSAEFWSKNQTFNGWLTVVMQRISLERVAVKHENQTTQVGQATLDMHPSSEMRTQLTYYKCVWWRRMRKFACGDG